MDPFSQKNIANTALEKGISNEIYETLQTHTCSLNLPFVNQASPG
jgi:hypothetical protein